MRDIFLTVIIGLCAGIIDILPMIKMKQDKYSISSAFVFYLIISFIIFGTDLFGMVWWLKGGILTLLLALPVMLIVMKTEKKAIPPILTMSILLGTLIGCSGYLLGIKM